MAAKPLEFNVSSRINAQEIKEVIERESDFGHEMKAWDLLSHFPLLDTKHGGTYIDAISQKPRQFDFRTSFQVGEIKFWLAIECKNLSAHSPLIVCSSPRSHKESFHEIIQSRLFKRGQTDFYENTYSVQRAGSDYYVEGEFVGKSLLRVKRDNKEQLISISDADVYDKWAQALSSAVELVDEATEASRGQKPQLTYSVILPIVVLPNDTLWEARYANSNSLSDPLNVDQCTLYVGREIRTGSDPFYSLFKFSHIHFCTLKGLQSLVSGLTINEKIHDALVPKSVRGQQ